MVEKVWGRTSLPAPFAARNGRRIGEIWFDPAPPCEGLLAKYLFTSEKLSVQVHPSDADAPEGTRGKEECWLVLDADEEAMLAIGFKELTDAETMRAAALDGSIEHMLDWRPAKRGDFVYLPAGTVHAIGPGLSLVEIQQNSDITYRLFDYGRPRDLHLDDALAVAQGAPHDPALRRSIDLEQSTGLVDGPHFRLDYVVGAPTDDLLARYEGASLVMPIEGVVEGEDATIAAGECGIVCMLASAQFSDQGSALIAQSLT
ncbi:class I mannose-6-phosphate isomerase [Pontixanthobacter aestiaquae]|uniref:Mannose-6-phosphate isomerase n=2 Tax=Pontixanthobacter aestiaquae TaxID=1509367 RepID=A0A844Z5Y4_9SPHN|nr:class I mannose-6-phosphate isomerase [Pontixanthobacter aestiaquae]MDN3646277.1 class I mannose-6-phosphate isomerase [Pontixanthobacter aestiaquae]MXO82732.1 mannose-6-phosphate isomerase [Pontixanthobacter aestiaquae]